MRFGNTQSRGEYDFDLEYSDGTKAVLEVTVSTDEAAEGTAAAIRNSRHGGPFVSRGSCAHDWYVHPVPGASINRIRAEVSTFLAAIEAEGRQEFNAWTDSVESPGVLAIVRELGVEQGTVMKWKSPGIGIALPGDGGLVEPELVNTAVEREASKRDNRRKLGAAPAGEKHLFVYITTTNHVVWVAVRDGPPPEIGPVLPPEVTHAWVAAWAGDGAWHVVWRARSGQSWTRLGLVDTDTGETKAV
jgi:hypothetical protein